MSVVISITNKWNGKFLMSSFFIHTAKPQCKQTFCVLWIHQTVCPRSIDPFYIVSYFIKWVTTSWTCSIRHFIVTKWYSLSLRAAQRPKVILFFLPFFWLIQICKVTWRNEKRKKMKINNVSKKPWLNSQNSKFLNSYDNQLFTLYMKKKSWEI